MKMIIIGEWAWSIYEEAFAQGLRDSGIEVSALTTSNFFKGSWGRVQKKIPFPGPGLLCLNRAVVAAVKEQQPDLVLFWRPTHVLPKTISMVKSMGVRTVSYNNDDPFGPKAHGNVPWHHHFLWHWYMKCLPLLEYNFFYRKINCVEAKKNGVRHADVLLPYYIPWQDRPVQLTAAELRRYETEVVFVGHYEPDGREGSIRALVNAGIRVKLWGGHYWSRTVLGDLYTNLSPIVPAEGSDYAKALCGAKVCLCFLSKLNRDTYTRRCFEIPACGKVMLAERTNELMQFFKEDEEACFFSSPEELVSKTQWLIKNPDIRERIAQAGLRRVWADGHDVASRARYFLSVVNKSGC
jgi:glycosyltransferase involved in cell wall biosynthesis